MSSKTKATAAEEDGKPGMVPKLRFPKFQGTPAWEETTIGAIGSFYYGKSAPKWSLEADAPTHCVRYGELYTKFGAIITATYSRTNIDPANLRFSKGGEILVPRVGEKPEDFGKCCCYLPLANIAIGEMISVFETEEHSLFYTYYFRLLYRQFAKVVEGQNVKNLYYTELEPLPIHRPTLPEQQKIAECLSSMDELIATQTQKLDALKTHKKGLMQELFPREEETRPRLRFPEFKNAGDWEATILGELIELQSGFAFSSDYFGSGGKKLVTPKNFTKFGFGNFDSTISKYTTEEVPPKFICNPGDLLLLLTDLTPTCELLGKPLEVAEKDGVVLLNQRIAKVEPISNGVTKPFLKQFFLTDTYNAIIVKTASGSTVKHSSNKIILNMGVVLPAPEEQQRIADCLASIDELIAAQTQKLAALKTHKNGLTQQLFPSSEEAKA